MINKKLDYYIFEGYDHYNNYPLYRVESTDKNDDEYVGEWNTTKAEAEKELNDLQADYEHKLNLRRNERFDVGGRIVGNFYFDSRKDKTFQVISIDGMRMGIQYFDRSKKPIGDIEFINKQEFDYYIFKGAWAEYKQPYFENGGSVDGGDNTNKELTKQEILSKYKGKYLDLLIGEDGKHEVIGVSNTKKPRYFLAEEWYNDLYAKGGNVSSIEKKVQEVNRLIDLANKNDISVIDSSSTWESPMKYKPIKYSNGTLYIEYQELDLYKNNRTGISEYITKKDKVLKRNMEFDNPLNDIAKMYRKALKQADIMFEDGGSVDGGDYVREDLNFYKKGGGVDDDFADLYGGEGFLLSKGYSNPKEVYFQVEDSVIEVTQAQKGLKNIGIFYFTENFENQIDKQLLDKISSDFGNEFSITLYTNAGVDLHSSSKGKYKNIQVERLKGNYKNGGNINAYQNNVDYINWQGENYIEDGGLEMEEERYSIIKKYIDFDTIKGIVDFDDNINNSLSKSNNYDETIITANLKFLKGGKIVGELRSYTIYNNSNDEGETKESIIFKNGTLIHINYTFGNTYTGFDPKRVYEKRLIDELQKQLYFHSKKQFKTGGSVDFVNTEVMLTENKPNGLKWRGIVKPFMLKSIEDNQYSGGFKRYEIDIYDEVDIEPTKESIEKANEFFDKVGGRYSKGGGIYSSEELYILKVYDLNNNLVDSSKRIFAKNLSKAKEIAIDDYESDMHLKYGRDLRFKIEEAPSMMAKGGGINEISKAESIKNEMYKAFQSYLNNKNTDAQLISKLKTILGKRRWFRYFKNDTGASDFYSVERALSQSINRDSEKESMQIAIDTKGLEIYNYSGDEIFDKGGSLTDLKKRQRELSQFASKDDENEMMSQTMNDNEYNNRSNQRDYEIDDSSIEDISQELSIVVTDELSQPVPNNVEWGNFFKDNPNKILGTEKEITTKYGEKVIRVIGDSEKINEVQVPIIDSHTPIQNIETIITDNVTTNNVTPSQIKKAEKLAKNSEKSLIKTKKLIAENREYELIPFDEFDAEYNAGITDDTKSAYVFYLQKISNNKLQGGFLKYDLGTSKEAERKLMNKGVLFYDLSEVDESRRYVPLFLFQTGNIYKKKQKLESQKDFYIENFGEKIYEIHLEKINEHYNLIWNRRLTLNDVDEKRRLVINPTSDIATDKNIFKVQSYMAGEYLKQSQSVYVSSVDGKQVIKPLKDSYSGKYSNRTTIYDYDLQLAFILYLKDIGGGERAKAQGIIYTNGMDYEMIYSYYLKNSPRPKTIEKDDWAKIKGYASQNGKRLFAHFLQFGLLPADRERLELLWNIEYNGNVEIDTLKVPIYFPMARMFRGEFDNKVRTEKRASVVFNMIKGSSLLAYGVGLGKTFCAIYNLAQNLEFGFCKRPLIILPNQVYAQFIKEINGIIPQYKINYLYNLKGVYAFLNQKIDDYSISVCTYEGLEEIAFSDNLDTNFFIRLGEILSGGQKMTQKQKEKEAEKYFELIGKAKSETSVEFDDLNTNWDYIVCDEAHNFKKLFTQVRGRAKVKTDAQVLAGAGNSYEKSEYQINSGTPSLRAIRLFFITQYVQQKSFNGNILLLTATPFTNSPLEVFTMLSFLNYNYLQLINLGNLKNFFDTFAIIKVEVVINPQLEPVRKQVFVGWANVVGLQDLIFRFMDKATKEMEEKAVDRPNKIVLPLNKKEINGVEYQLADADAISTTLALTPMQLSLWETLLEYAEGEIQYEDLLDTKNLTTCGKIATREKVKSTNDEGEEVEEEVVSLKSINDKEKGLSVRTLQCLTYGRQLAVSPYLYRFSGQQDEPTAKQYVQSSPKFLYTMACIKSVKEHHESKGTRMSGQIIFMNIGTLCFHYLAEYLVSEIGYKENEVAIISGTNSRIGNKKYTKSQVQDKYLGRYFNEEEMNFEDIDDSERVKVLIGSASIQEGLNLQKYSSVLYNLYIGFNPTDQIQLEGRIWRQGNQYNNVRIVIPLMENSMDIFMFQKLQEKTQRINEIWARTGKNEIDTTEFNAEELKYTLITNSLTLARFSLDEDKQKIDDEINDLNYQFSTIKNIAQIYKTISSFYQDGQKYSNITIKNFFEYTRVGYMYAILKTFRADLVPLPMFIDDISERGNDISLQTYTTFISAQGKQKKYSFSDKMLNYKVKDIIDLMVQFRKDSKIYVPKGYKYENFIKPTFEKKDIITFNAPITTKDKKGVEKTEIKKLEGVVKLINDDNTADDYLEVFVKGYEDFFEVALKDIVIVEKTQKEFYNIGTKEFTDNFLPISYFQFMNNILENSNYKDKIYDVFETISYADDYVNLREKQVDFIEEYKGNIDEPTFWGLIESNLFDQRLTSNDFSNGYDNYKYVDVYSYSYLKEFNNVEKAERDILKPKGINNEEELASRLEQLTLDIKQKGQEKQEIDSTEYLMKKVSVIEQMRQKEKENPLRKASTFLQRAKEFQTANAEYKGNEYLDDIKVAEVEVEKTIEVNAKVIKTLTIDDRIKGLKIVLKLAKGDNKAIIEKRIKGLEIVKKTQKFGYGGSLNEKPLVRKINNEYYETQYGQGIALMEEEDGTGGYWFMDTNFDFEGQQRDLKSQAKRDFENHIAKNYTIVDKFPIQKQSMSEYKKGGNVVRISVLNELYNLKNEGVTQVQLNGFNESIGYVIGLRLDDTEIKKVGNNAYITLYKTGGSVMSNKANGILYSTDGTQKTINFAGKFAPLKELQKLVGGYIELIYLKDNMILVVNEDGLGYNLPSNKNATKIVVSQNKGYGIVGNAFLINSKYIN